MPMMQFSVAPWRILGEEQLTICRQAAQLHTEFANTILSLARTSSVTGEPIVRHMEYVFPHQGYGEIKDQFMLGDSVLVAPVLERGARSRHIRFPQGTWKGEDGSIVEGPASIEIQVPLARLPWYKRL
jgi:alpha-glucosidase (family GH31 glycosyl hydrolase)